MNKEVKCKLCRGNCLSIDQLFMLPNVVWASFCLDKGISMKSTVCADCYEKHLGRRLETSDLVMVPLNLVFLSRRHPDLYERFKKGVEMSANTELLLFMEGLHIH